jgi:Ca2+-binding RTX toxin-like protein
VSVEAISATLRPGSQLNVSVDVAVTELPPIYDVFMLQDLSGSFWDDLPNVQARFSELFDTLSATSDVNFGVGSFIDKPVEEFGSDSVWLGYDETGAPIYTSDYVYKTHLGVTGDKAAIQDSLDNLTTQYGSDWKEAQLEGLVQVALRSDEVGFRDGAQKFVVLSTDAAAHEEGDYYWAPEGANDYDTVIEDEDYPAIEAVGALLEAAGIIPVFAVTEYVIDYYQALVDTWGFGSVTLLSSDSSNLATAIEDGLKAATTDLTMSVVGDDFGYVSSTTPEFYDDVGAGTYTFDVTLEIPEDSVDYSSDSMTLVIEGYGEVTMDIAIAEVDATGDSGDDTISGDDGSNALYGLAGADTLDGRGGDDTLVGGAGDDTLTGGAGDDLFDFGDGDGKDTITDFGAGTDSGDVIDLRRLTAVSNFNDVMSAAAQVGDDAVLDFGGGDSIALVGVDATKLEAQDFLL